MPYGDDRLTGKQQYIVYRPGSEEDGLNDVFIPVTMTEPRFHKCYQDVTSGQFYHPDTGLIYPARLATAVEVEIEIDGRFRLSTTPYTFIRDMFNGEDEPVTLAFHVDFQNRIIYSKWTISDFRMRAPVEDVVNFSAMLKGQGLPEVFNGYAGLA